MNPIVKKDILLVLGDASLIVKTGEFFKLRELSDHVIHNVSIFQDKDSITIAVTIYSLSKLYIGSQDLIEIVLPHLTNAKVYLEKDEYTLYEKEISHILRDISRIDKKTKDYVQEVLEKGQIKKGSRMFEHGISLSHVADALGVSLWELVDYVGKTNIIDTFENKTDIKEKMNFARKLFSKN